MIKNREVQETFSLTNNQVETAEKWIKEQNLKLALKQIMQDPETCLYSLSEIEQSIKDGDPQPYTGTMGGIYTYIFTPTGVGQIVRLKNLMTNEEINLTEYDLW